LKPRRVFRKRSSSQIQTIDRALPRWENLEPRTLLSASPTGLTPAEVRQAYSFNDITFNNSSNQTVLGDGSGQTIAIVDPYVSATLVADLNKFDQTFSLGGGQTLYQEFGAATSFRTQDN